MLTLYRRHEKSRTVGGRRGGKILDTVAVLIAKLSDTDQPKALAFAVDDWDTFVEPPRAAAGG